MTRHILVMVLFCGLTLFAAGCDSLSPGDEDSPIAARREPAFVVLLENNRLLALDSNGRVVWRLSLGPRAGEPVGARYVSVAGPNRFGLVVPGPTRDQLVYVSASGRVHRRIALPAGVRFRAIAQGSESGRVYLAGEIRTSRPTQFEGFAHKPVIVMLSSNGRVQARTTLHDVTEDAPGGGPSDWRIYGFALAANETRLFISYHGPNTSGADWVDVGKGSLSACPRRPGRATCIPEIHGALEVYGDELLATLGTPPLLGGFTKNGVPRQTWPSALGNAHLMEFARRQSTVFAIESCTKTGGLAAIDLSRGRTRVLAAPAPTAREEGLGERDVCGERIAVSRGKLAVMKRGTITGIAGIMLTDDRGQHRRWVPLSPAPLDLAALLNRY
jgi:hypothetical protein